MAHGIMSDDTLFSARLTPWHGMGKVTDRALTVEEAKIESGLDWRVEKRPLFFPGNSNDMIEALEAFSVVRLSDMKSLGVVGEGYNPFQNEEAFDFADSLLQQGATYETAGSLFGGKRIFITANLRQVDILDDKVNEYLVITSSHDGSSPLMGMITPVRVVCNNTLRMAIDDASRIVKLRHTKNVSDRVDTARKILAMAHKYTDKMAIEAERMASISFNGNILDTFIDQVFGFKEEDSTRMKNLQIEGRDRFVDCLMADDVQNFGGTAWGTYQALADFDSHRPVPRDSQNSKDRNFLRVVEGNNWLENQTSLMMKMADAV